MPEIPGIIFDLLARAGGGEGYGGGGGFGGGGGGGDGGDGQFIWLLIQLVIRYPKLGIPAVILFVAFAIYSQKKGIHVYKSNVIRRGATAVNKAREFAAIERLRAADPGFDPQAFYDRVGSAFVNLQDAWCRQDLKTVRPFISDGIYERFSLQFLEQQDQNRANRMDNLRVHSVSLAHLQSDAAFDVATVRIHASATDHFVSLTDGRKVSGSTTAGDFVEFWSFLRRRGARTQPGRPGLMEGNCPNCGSAVEMNQSANCANCASLLRSGEFDWVLSEITQEAEWAEPSSGMPPGFSAVAARDRHLNLQELEDRTSVIFWRRATAERLGKIDPLRKMATNAYCESYGRGLRSDSKQSYFAQCAVGSVETRGFLSDGPFDFALVEVRWSGRRFIRAKREDYSDEPFLSRTLFVLARKQGVSSDPGKAISSAHCPNCGAPEVGGVSNACEYCNTVLNDGSTGWVLAEAVSMLSPRAEELLGRLQGISPAEPMPVRAHAPDAEGILAWLIKMIHADGRVEPRERELMETVAKHHGVPKPRVEMLMRAAQGGQFEPPEPRDFMEAREWMTVMAKAALVDGTMHPEEQALLHAAGSRVGFTQYDIRQIVKSARTDLYSQAKGALRAQKNGTP